MRSHALTVGEWPGLTGGAVARSVDTSPRPAGFEASSAAGSVDTFSQLTGLDVSPEIGGDGGFRVRGGRIAIPAVFR